MNFKKERENVKMVILVLEKLKKNVNAERAFVLGQNGGNGPYQKDALYAMLKVPPKIVRETAMKRASVPVKRNKHQFAKTNAYLIVVIK